MSDLKFALRSLLKTPGFTAVAILTLALGLGANALVFAVTKTLLFRPLGFPDPHRLAWIRIQNTRTGATSDMLSWRDMQDIRESVKGIQSIATFGFSSPIWERNGRPEEHPTLQVTLNMQDLLGVRPVLGRLFLQSDFDDGAEDVVLISHELWVTQFGGRTDLPGETIRIDKKLFTIVGVLPPNLHFPLERSPTLGTGNNIATGVKSFWFPLKTPRGEDFASRG